MSGRFLRRWRVAELARGALLALLLACACGGTGYAQPAAPPQQNASSATPNPWRKTLPNGVEVELTAVGMQFTKESPWWRPDGTTMTLSGALKTFGVIMRGLLENDGYHPPDHPSERCFFFRVHFAGESAKYFRDGRTTTFDAPVGTALSDHGCMADASQEKTIIMGAACHDLRSTHSLRVGVAAGPYELVDAYRPGDKPAPKWAGGRATIFEPVTTTTEGVRAGFSHNRTGDGRYYRIVALMRDGAINDHCWEESRTDGSRTWTSLSATFKAPLDQIAEFQLQSTPYQWAEFPVPACAVSMPALPAPATITRNTTATLRQSEERRAALAELEKEKTLAALRRLLRLNGQDEGLVERLGPADAGSPSARHVGQGGVLNVTVAYGQSFVVVHGRRWQAIPPDKRKDYPQGLGVALYFYASSHHASGLFIGELGGEWGPDGGDDVETGPLGKSGEWFTAVSRPMRHGEFTRRTDVHVLMGGQRLWPVALRVYGREGDWVSRNDTLTTPAGNFEGAFLPGGEKGAEGRGCDGKPHSGIIGWAAKERMFKGPTRLERQGKAVYEVDLERSTRFVPADREQPGFEALYRLAPGEALRRVAPPFRPERAAYLQTHAPIRNGFQNYTPTAIEFKWEEGLMGGGSLKLGRQVLGTDEGLSLAEVLDYTLGWRRYEFELAGGMQAREKVTGDWIVRTGAAQAERIAALERILGEYYDQPVRIEKRREERQALVASGRFEYRHLPEPARPGSISIYNAGIPAEPWGLKKSGQGKTVGAFLAFMGGALGVRIIDETAAQGQETPLLDWNVYDMPASTDQAAMTRLLDNVTQQTGLQFRWERRPVELWMIHF